MKSIIQFFAPVNAATVGGLILTIIGFLLLPFIIGLPLMILGIVILCIGILSYLFDYFPYGKRIKNYFKEILRRLKK